MPLNSSGIFIFVFMNKQPIGFFDSGVGGTSIWKEVNALLPYENTIYLADSKNAPYGLKGQKNIIDLSIKNTEFLLKKRCKCIIVACNTATTNAIHVLRSKYNVPFIGIEPAIKPAALKTKTKAIGILATKGTLSSALFHKTYNLYSEDTNIIEQEGNGIVELIESGKIHSKTMYNLLENYLNPMIKANIDYLVLGCTHYSYLIPLLKKILPKQVKIIDSGKAVAKQTNVILSKNNLLNTSTEKPELEFYTNASTDIMTDILNNKYLVKHLDF